MPKYRITSPDGQEFEVSTPDGVEPSQDELVQFVTSQNSKPADPFKGMGLSDIQAKYREARKAGADEQTLAGIADAYVNKEQQRASNSEDYFGQGVLNAADNFVRDFASGAFGGIDETSAFLNSLNPIGGGDYQENLDYERARSRYNEKQFGALNTATQIGGGVAGAVAGARALGLGGTATQTEKAARIVMPTLGQAAKTGAIASGIGAADMFTRGEGGFGNRAGNAAFGAVLAGPLGFVSPYVGGAIAGGAQKVTDFIASDAMLKRLGISRDAAEVLLRQLAADDTLTTKGRDRIARGGADAMLADAGDSSMQLLDTALQRSGPGATAAREAIAQRLARADGMVRETLDNTLGKPVGIGQRMTAIRSGTAEARNEAYEAAFKQPINYANASGQKLEGLFKRIPGEAWGYAAKLMKVDGDESLQRLLQVADDGTITLKAMPDMRQMSYVKEALDALAAQGDGMGQLGGQTKMGRALERLSNLVRDTLADNVKPYRAALDTAAEPAREVAALKFGRTVLSDATSVDDVVMQLKGATKPEAEAVRKGIRDYLDNVLGRVKALSDDADVGPEELTKTIRELSSRNARNKLKLVLGDREFRAFYGQLGRFAKAAQMKQAVAKGSQTYARTATTNQVNALGGSSVLELLKQGSVGQATKRIFQVLLRATPEERLALEDKLYSDIANALTQTKGQKAQEMLLRLKAALDARSSSNELARVLGARTTAGTIGANQSVIQQAITE
jgi:hypothetical protein